MFVYSFCNLSKMYYVLNIHYPCESIFKPFDFFLHFRIIVTTLKYEITHMEFFTDKKKAKQSKIVCILQTSLDDSFVYSWHFLQHLQRAFSWMWCFSSFRDILTYWLLFISSIGKLLATKTNLVFNVRFGNSCTHFNFNIQFLKPERTKCSYNHERADIRCPKTLCSNVNIH